MRHPGSAPGTTRKDLSLAATGRGRTRCRQGASPATASICSPNQTVKDYIIEAINRYLDMGVDALRIDTVKHIERDNLLEYINAWKAHKPGCSASARTS